MVVEATSWEEYVSRYITLEEQRDALLWRTGELLERLQRQFPHTLSYFAAEVGCSKALLQKRLDTADFWEVKERQAILTWAHHHEAMRSSHHRSIIVEAADNLWSLRQLRERINQEEGVPPKEPKRCPNCGAEL